MLIQRRILKSLQAVLGRGFLFVFTRLLALKLDHAVPHSAWCYMVLSNLMGPLLEYNGLEMDVARLSISDNSSISFGCSRNLPPRSETVINQFHSLTTGRIALLMEVNTMHHVHEEDDEEFVLLDLDVLCGRFEIPPNAPYVLSGLDTLNPILIIDNKIKLIGEYEETIGTCFVFSEDEAAPIVHEETGSSELNLFSGKCIIDSNQAPRKQLKPVACLHKVLKFRVLLDDDIEDVATGPSNSN